MHPVLVFFSEASAFVCCLRQDIGLDGPFIYPGVAVFCVWGVEWAVMIQDLMISNVTFLSCLNLYGCSASSAFLKSCSQQKCSIGGGKESVPSSRALLCIYVFLCIYFGLDGDFFFFSPLNRIFRKVTSFLIPDSLWALKKILDNTEQLRCHFNSSFK